MLYSVESLSARRAWIEIIDDLEPSSTRKVALRKESVDRNCSVILLLMGNLVALRKESVDRNQQLVDTSKDIIVALRKESVDRNQYCCPYLSSLTVALRKESVDRNGVYPIASQSSRQVALRKESVDRNRGGDTHANRYYTSLSARRAWIEIARARI